jgi:hypothetical protein
VGARLARAGHLLMLLECTAACRIHSPSSGHIGSDAIPALRTHSACS